MINAVGAPQSVLVVGGTSEIGLAIAERFVRDRTRRVVLAGRDGDRLSAGVDRLCAAGATDVTTLPFEASDPSTHDAMVRAAFSGVDIDVAVLAFGMLGDQRRAEMDASHAVDVVTTNYVAAVSVGVPLAKALSTQGHGVLVVLSSVAGLRARRSNFVYGSSKAGLDAFATGLGEALRGSGVRVLIVRPGFVRTRMTAHLEPAPLSTTAASVADAVADAVRLGRAQVWVPPAMRYVMLVLRHLPQAVFRRLGI